MIHESNSQQLKLSRLAHAGYRAGGPTHEADSHVAEVYSRLSDWMEHVSWYDDARITEILQNYIPVWTKRVLELGCGTGRLLHHLALLNDPIDFVGIDISPGMVEKARRRNLGNTNVTISCGDWLSTVDKDKQDYDIVVVKNALHLLGQPEDKLRELHDVTRPSAGLIVVETVSPIPARFIRALFTQLQGADAVKRNFFTATSLRKRVASGGWKYERGLYLKQAIDVEDWVRHKAINDESAAAALELIRAAPPEVKEKMEISLKAGGSKMLRLQFVGAFQRHEEKSQETCQAVPAADPDLLDFL